MAIVWNNIVITSNVVSAPCNVGIFNIDVIITGRGALGDVYKVELWDQDFALDDILATLTANVRLRRRGLFRHIKAFTLRCDENCHVKGNAGNSGEETAEVYAYVRDIAANGARKNSPVLNLTCDEDLQVVCDDSTMIDAGKIKIEFQKGDIVAGTKVQVHYPCEQPDIQYFPDEVNPDIFMVSIGDAGLPIKNGADVVWSLSKRLLNKLSELDGMVVRYDQGTETWEIVLDHTIKGSELRFKIYSGGLYGIAANSRYFFDGDNSIIKVMPDLPPIIGP